MSVMDRVTQLREIGRADTRTTNDRDGESIDAKRIDIFIAVDDSPRWVGV